MLIPLTILPDCPLPNRPGARLKGWHGRDWVYTACFVDSHVSLVRMHGSDCPPQNLGNTYPKQDIPPGMTPYSYWRCITIRGPGWQLDTLPSPPIGIGLDQDDVW